MYTMNNENRMVRGQRKMDFFDPHGRLNVLEKKVSTDSTMPANRYPHCMESGTARVSPAMFARVK